VVATTRRADAVSIEVRGLNKNFGIIQAVADLNFTVSPGRVTGFLGPNGAGKTTTLRILLGLVHATSGTATIGRQRYGDIIDPLRRVGALLEATSFHPARRARDHLRICALAARIETARVDEVLELVGLRDAAKRRVGGFSLGMRQRLGLATALLGDPPVLILDEPANGLDPQGIAWLREFLRYLAGQGHTVLVSSHLLAEMSQIVDDVVIIAGGRVRASGPLSELTGRVRSAMRVRTPEADRLQGVLAAAHWASRRLSEDLVLVEGVTPELLGPVLARSQIVTYELLNQSTDLEAVFLSLTGSDSQPPLVAPSSEGPRP
jgi:ABC-2 type transport system ATP-binding protein